MAGPQIRKIGILAWALAFSCFLAALSFYYFPHVPTTLDPATGHTHPLNNHGHITYLNHGQWLAHVAFLALALAFGIVFGLAVYGQLRLKKQAGR